MCVGISLIFLSTYFSWAFPEYTASIFYIVNTMLLSSILILVFLSRHVIDLSSKLVVLSTFFLLIYFALVIVESLYYLNPFGVEVVNVFSTFFIMCSITLMLISSVSLKKEEAFNNSYLLLFTFSPIIIYSMWVLINNSLFLEAVLSEQLSLRLFLTAFSTLYVSVIVFNMISSAIHVLSVREKYFLISAGVGLILLFSGFKQASFIPELSPIITVIGCFLLCFGLLMESNLNLHNRLINLLLNKLKKKKRKDFIKFLKSQFSKDKILKVLVSNEEVNVFDNPDLSNVEEKRKYDQVLVSCFKWFKRNVKGSDKFLKKLKVFYNTQVVLSKRLNLFLI